MRRREIEATWRRVGDLLRYARAQLAHGAAHGAADTRSHDRRSDAGPRTASRRSRRVRRPGPLDEYAAFAAEHEWERAWDALASAAAASAADGRPTPGPEFWAPMAAAARLMGLEDRRAEAERIAGAGEATALPRRITGTD